MLEAKDCPEIESSACLMATPRLLTTKDAERIGARFSVDGRCCKTHYMLKYIEQREDSQFSVVAQSNMIDTDFAVVGSS